MDINDGTVLYVMRDITDYKGFEKDLKKYKNIISSTLDGIAFLDENYRYIIVNDAYARFSGIDRSQLIGLTLSKYLGEDVFKNIIKPNFDRMLARRSHQLSGMVRVSITRKEIFRYHVLSLQGRGRSNFRCYC